MVSAILSRKGLRLNYANVVPTVGNYIAKYHPEKSFVDGSLERTLQQADEKSAEIANQIREKETRAPDKWSFVKAAFYRVGNLYFRLMAKKLTVSDECINCGICVKVCPTGNIQSGEKKPAFQNKNCTQCMACVQWCPKKAINCGEETAARNRYHNPAVSLQDMTRAGEQSG
jgi:ferredoxin